MSEALVDEHGRKPAAGEARANTNRRAQWAVEVKGVREMNRGKYWVQKRADLVNEAGEILDRAQVEGRDLTDGEKR